MELIEKFRKSPTIFNYEEVLNILFPKANSCRLCKSPIFYENDTNVRIKRSGKIEITGKSSYTKKKHGHSLSCCEKCLAKKFPSWKNINKSKVFNTLNEITIWAFDIPDKDLILYKTGVSESVLEKKNTERLKKKKDGKNIVICSPIPIHMNIKVKNMDGI